MAGSLFPVFYILFGKTCTLKLVLSCFFAVSAFELLRLKNYIRPKWLNLLIKEAEKKRPTGSFFFLLSCLTLTIFFEERVAIMSMFILSLSDPLAALVGQRIGKKRVMGKSLEGSFSFLLLSCAILYLGGEVLMKTILVSLIATIVEIFSTKLDDNLTVPLVTAISIQYLTF